MSNPDPIESFFSRHLTLDLIGLSEEQRDFNSMLLGGSAAEYINIHEDFEYGQISHVVFRWGDPMAGDLFTAVTNNIDLPGSGFIPFAPVALIGNELWMLTPQESNWDPATAYEKEDDYVLIPYQEEGAVEALAAGLIKTRLHQARDIIGKIGDHYVVFSIGAELEQPLYDEESWALEAKLRGPAALEPSTDSTDDDREVFANSMTALINTGPVADLISDAGATQFLEGVINAWQFEEFTDEGNVWLALNVALWAVENFGQGDIEHGYTILTPDQGKEIRGEELPLTMRHLVTHVWKDEVFLTNKSEVRVETQSAYFEHDPLIPHWEEIEQLVSIPKMLEFIRSHPEIRDNIRPTSIEIVPQVNLVFRPDYIGKWGLEFIVNQNGIKVIPFGDRGQTELAVNFASEMGNRQTELARIVAELALLAVQHNHARNGDSIAGDAKQLFAQRITEEIALPLTIPNDFHTKSANAIKNVIIEILRKEADEDFLNGS